ncbi:MAG: Queuosine synthesis-like protein [Candidatus Eremiobacteraeota bacterium]|nr:Queuosine synthesis-like protein [Candidatus Eremiobacteraeota bacterium]
MTAAPVEVLLSGGIDSAACVALYRAAGREVTGVFLDYGQAAAIPESGAATRIARHYGIGLRLVTVQSDRAFGAGEIMGRNGMLVFAALTSCRLGEGSIAIGIHTGTSYADCSRDFFERISDLVALGSGGSIALEAPFLDWFKHDVLTYADRCGVPRDLTYSCELGTNPSCGRCASCVDVRIYRNMQDPSRRRYQISTKD